MQEKEQLVQKLFSQQCSREELKKLFKIIREEPDETAPSVLTELLKQMEGENLSLDDKATQNRIFDKVLSEISESESNSTTRIATLKPKKRIYLLGKIAATILLLIIAGWWVFQLLTPSEIVVLTGYGERKEINLPDGSLVLLNSKSVLRYAPNWEEGKTRVVSLEGEAYFEVAKEEIRQTKFQVLTRDLVVEVLGTVFNVNTRKEATKVYLEEGKVRLNLADEKSSELLLNPGEVMSYSATKRTLVSPQKVAGELETSWKDGFLIFRARPLIEILETLAAISNFEFEIKTTKFNQQVWTMALPNDNIENAIDIIGSTTGATITKNGIKYIIDE
jgi:ferric-dicitrate binding protein FerR (iron transport regulator)